MPATDEAIVLAGGLGTRLRDVIGDLPKALAPVAGRPFLAWLLDGLAAQGMRRVILATGHGADRVLAAFGTQWRGLEIVHSRESGPLGTGGAVALAMSRLEGDDCFVLNGDTRVALDFHAFQELATARDARLGVALSQQADVSRYGAVHVQDGQITGFSEKGESGRGLVNAGVYWVARALTSAFPDVAAFSFEADVLVPTVRQEAVVAFTATSGFIDIGVPEDYRRAQRMFARAGSER